MVYIILGILIALLMVQIISLALYIFNNKNSWKFFRGRRR